MIRWIDDLTGEDVEPDQVQTVRFGFEGVEYEIDLGPENAERLNSILAQHAAVARKVSSGPRRHSAAPKAPSEQREAREWLKANGYPVPPRGRVSADLMDVWRQNKDVPQEEAPAPKGEPLLVDTSDEAVIEWHKSKGYKINTRQMGLMRDRYKRAFGVA